MSFSIRPTPSPSVRSAIEPFRVMDMWKAAAQRQQTHGDVLTLAAGQPSTPAPAPVLRAAREALGSQLLGYTESLGIPELRKAIAQYHSQKSGITVEPDEVIVTTGSSAGLTLAFLAAFDIGDTVVTVSPGYPAYRNSLKALGCQVIELPCGPETGYQLTVGMLESCEKPPQGVVLASPANPTGAVIDPREFLAVIQWCDEHGTLLISDEIYHGISYEGVRTMSAWEASRRSVVLGSASKYFSMTGWRLGWMLVPESLQNSVERLASNMTVCPPAISQYAAVAAFGSESIQELQSHVYRYSRNKEILINGLAEQGITNIAPAQGAFYVYADVSHLTNDSTKWCASLLERTGVALAPGIDFDTARGLTTIRLCFAGRSADIDQALDRMIRSGLALS
ncbi:MAG: pyridoxal phosphate-dependent aminotransferase [Mycobacteriaceae bacterium]